MKVSRLLVLMSMAVAAQGQTSADGRYGFWSARGEYGEEFLCSLDNWAVDAGASELLTADRITLYFVWKASQGLTLNVWGRPVGGPRVHVEVLGAEDTWDADLDERRILLAGADAEKLVQRIGEGHDVAVTLNYRGKSPQRYIASRNGSELSVPMFDACVRAAAPGVAPVPADAGRRIFQMIDSRRCGIRQWFMVDEFPLGVSFWVDRKRGEFDFSRRTSAESAHGARTKYRKEPDEVEAAALFGGSFAFMDEWDFPLTLEQADAIAADLSAGKSRTLTLKEPSGKVHALEFGGAHARPSAAMLAVCRDIHLEDGPE